MDEETSRRVPVGEVRGAFGVRGWIKVRSYTEPPENILRYTPWFIAGREAVEGYRIVEGERHGEAVVAHLQGVDDRDQAALLQGRLISVERDQFPPPEPGRYYWADLLGLEVRTLDGLVLGRIGELLETGANDVLVVRGERERLIPFVLGEFVKRVDLDQGVMTVDWDPDF